MTVFWNGRDADDEFGEWVELPKEYIKFNNPCHRVNNYMRDVRKKHKEDCETDPEKKLYKRGGPSNQYWKCLPDSRKIDVEYYAKEFEMSEEDVIKMFNNNSFKNGEV